MSTLEQLKEQDIWCKEETLTPAIKAEVLRLLRSLNLDNLADLLEGYEDMEEHVDTITSHFGVDIEQVADWCDEYMIDHIEDYCRLDEAHEYCGCNPTEKGEEFANSMDTTFNNFLEDTDYVRQRFGMYIFTEDALTELRSLFHQELSYAGLE